MKNQPDMKDLPEALFERVQARVATAAQSLERRATASRPKVGRRRASSTVLSDGPQNTEKELAEQSLRQVFRDLGVSYRRYRKQTGTPVLPALRDAACNFRAEPSLASLVAVAAYLDELDLLN